MEKQYKKIELVWGCSLEQAVVELVSRGAKKEFVCADFNGTMLYSDTVGLDSAFLETTGKTYFDKINEREENRQRRIKEEKEYQESVPSLVDDWIQKGNEILDVKYQARWKDIVPMRLSDLYHGMELGATLEIVSVLNSGCTLEDAKTMIYNQNHSGMSYGLVRAMVREFCDRGNEFSEYVK